jgi:hypothetical protein
MIYAFMRRQHYPNLSVTADWGLDVAHWACSVGRRKKKAAPLNAQLTTDTTINGKLVKRIQNDFSGASLGLDFWP